MKKVLALVLALVMFASLAGCAQATVAPTEAPKATATAAAAAPWTIKIGSTSIVSTEIAKSLQTVTLTLKKVSKDGSLKDQKCTGYTIASVLAFAKVTSYTKLTFVAKDGVKYDLTKELAALGTTLLVLEQDGEVNLLPRLAVDGKGSDAWLKDVVEIIVVK